MRVWKAYTAGTILSHIGETGGLGNWSEPALRPADKQF
jgi:hypothetical protein